MKPNCLLRSPSSILIFSIFNPRFRPIFSPSLFHHPKFHTFSSSPISSCISPISVSSSIQTSLHKPQTPLFLRQPLYSSTLSDLHTFIDWAKTLVSSVGSSFEEIDNGPESSLLLRELKWLLDDTLEHPLPFSHLGTPQSDELCAKKVVNLRTSLDQMYRLWEQRIQERKPFQYIVGCEHWRDLVLSVEEGVLIPRPETEKIVDLVEDVVTKCGVLNHGLWADLGTGSGALAIGIARVLGKNSRVIAIDLSPIAVSVAKYNVERYGLQHVIEIKKGSWFEPLKDVEGEVAGLVSNPPYIPSEDMSRLQAEVGKHEPKLALDGGVEGLDHLSYLIKRTSTLLKPGGFFAFETNGEKHCKLLAESLKDVSSLCGVNIVPDFNGITRFVTGFRCP